MTETLSRAVGERRLPPPDLGPLLRRARLRSGLGLREAARRIGTGHGYLGALEAGTRCPSTTIARALAEVLELSPVELAVLTDAAVDDRGRDHPWRRGAETPSSLPKPRSAVPPDVVP